MATLAGDGAAMLEEDVAFQGFLEGGAGGVKAGLDRPAGVPEGGSFDDLSGQDQRAGVAEVAVKLQLQEAIRREGGIRRPAQAVHGEGQ